MNGMAEGQKQIKRGTERMTKRTMAVITVLSLLVAVAALTGGLMVRLRRQARVATDTLTVTPTPRPVSRVTAEPALYDSIAAAQPQPTTESGSRQVTIESVTGTGSSRTETLLTRNANAYADVVDKVYTTQEGVIFVFELASDAGVQQILDALASVGGQGVFFVSPDAIEQYAETLRRIAMSGNDIGFILTTARYVSTEEMLNAILTADNTMRTVIGYSGTICVRQASGRPSTMLRLAASAGNYPLLSQTMTIEEGSASAAIEGIRLYRGDIVFFKPLKDDLKPLAGSVRELANSTRLRVTSASDMLSSNQRFVYPIESADILPSVRGRIRPGALTGDVFMAISSRYIGASWLKGTGFLPGFTDEEARILDKQGMYPNDYNEVYLTFDGWGSEQTIKRVLEILEKHKADATFFIRSGDAKHDPAVLRDIATRGFAIGSNTHTGMSLANYVKSGKFDDLTEAQAAKLREDVITSYEVLSGIIGDLTRGETTKPVLTTLFRPPLLSVSKTGLETVLGCGYSYSVGGIYTYESAGFKDAEIFAAKLKKDMKSGCIMIFHLEDLPDYMLNGLDSYLLANSEAKKPFVFASLADALK